MVEARIRVCEDSKQLTIRRSIVVLWAKIWTTQADSQTGQPKSDRLLGSAQRRQRN